ncbi:MAG TPA: hypothetical protein DEQ78_08845 [Ruminococcaceae bacterium]|nr:hypothetical protein [Oscillospiraceae bacterium]HCE27367.1 hypothetical protein [Oscillospiraceae bacterium]
MKTTAVSEQFRTAVCLHCQTVFLSDKLTAKFGKRFTVSNLRNMRQFYLAFPKRYTVCSNLSRSHYRVLMRISDSKRRAWYTDECAESSASLQSYPRL